MRIHRRMKTLLNEVVVTHSETCYTMSTMQTQLNHLNSAQRDAVTATERHCLVLAGAGSGKTRVLTQRFAWLVQEQGLSPHSLLAVTFTNKAAREMHERIGQLLKQQLSGLWIGTFHSIAHRLLRQHSEEAKLPKQFQIFDSDDQLRLVKRLMKEENIDDKQWPPRQMQWFINHQKEQGLRAKNCHVEKRDSNSIAQHTIYTRYENYCQQQGIVDFAELLLRSYELLNENTALKQHYQSRFEHILVDEFQDTNTIQCAWLRLFNSGHNGLMMVGDDDQSIYGWRGAKIENIQRFHVDFPEARTIRLEQNYRSTGHILNAANSLIAHNEKRLGKSLWTDGAVGEQISVYEAFNEQDEVQFVIDRIKQHKTSGTALKDCAILYRSNAQSRLFEEYLLKAKIPYRIYGGQRFYERAEIKDALAYFRLVITPEDNTSFERCVNWPPRGIGDKTLEQLRDIARELGCSLWQAVTLAAQQQTLTARALTALQQFVEKINLLQEVIEGEPLATQMQLIIDSSGLITHFSQEKGEQGRARVENLQELINAASMHTEILHVADFLNEIALDSGDTQASADESAVQLMTLHSANGLEFPVVFLTGLEEGLFPHQQSLGEKGQEGLQEERRLCYVGITRAMQKLYLTHAESRALYGKLQINRPSRFLSEIDEACLAPIRLKKIVNKSAWSTSYSQAPTPRPIEVKPPRPKVSKKQQKVRHPKFGDGVILEAEGAGESARVRVSFKEHGEKWLVCAFAKLEVIS